MGGNQLVTESQAHKWVQAGLDRHRLLSQRRKKKKCFVSDWVLEFFLLWPAVPTPGLAVAVALPPVTVQEDDSVTCNVSHTLSSARLSVCRAHKQSVFASRSSRSSRQGRSVRLVRAHCTFYFKVYYLLYVSLFILCVL